jgi:glycine/D-amino acid oxidase-like deaminating enzyme
MEQVDVLVVGQGLAGSWLSWWLERAGLSYLVMDNHDPLAASRHAAGLINPVTGRRLVKTWMIDELMPFAWKAYREMGEFLGLDLIREMPVVDFFPTAQMLLAFRERVKEENAYLAIGTEPSAYETWFNYELGWGTIAPCYLVYSNRLLPAWRKQLSAGGRLRVETFRQDKLVVNDAGCRYDDIHCRHLVFCDGRYAASNPFFEKLPFALNKGEGLLVEIPDLPADAVFKKSMSIVPWQEQLFWVGSSYQWTFDNEQPSENFRSSTENWLKHLLRVPFKTMDHFAAIRPATLERRPFVGFHPLHPGIGLFNGLGTKGCSLAPFFAFQLLQKIMGRGILDPGADIQRFRRILGDPTK